MRVRITVRNSTQSAAKMLDFSELPDLPTLKQLARALWHNGSIRGAALMVGAGFTKNAILGAPDTQEPPSWNELISELVAHLYPTDQSHAPNDALRIAEEYRVYFGQAALDGFIRTRFADLAWLPSPLHLQALTLPWSDVLTTNWDTLLERTADEVTEFIYEVVRTEVDIAHTRSPRIVKLHGTLGDKDPLIFTAEDYRTYPIRHAAFVNLARQIFIENDLCLLGFSGTDPNFLEWAGWVRDQLGGNARRIYLAGYLDLSASARKYMEAQNIAPIDLAPLVNELPTPQRHNAATKKFLDALRAEQPHAPDDWKKHEFNVYPLRASGPDAFERARKDEAFAAKALIKTAQLLRKDRENYPGWLVCPRVERYGLNGHDEWAFFRPSVLAHIEPPERASILSEFLWQYTITFSKLSPKLRDALVATMDASQPPIENRYRLMFAVALMRDARMDGNDSDIQKWGAIIDAEATADASERMEAQYQRCLRLRDQLDLAGLTNALDTLTSANPLWQLRQAGLYAEVGEHARATKLIKEAATEFEKAYRSNRNSIWLQSCLGWASWLNRVADMGGSDQPPRAREFRKVDPTAELEALADAANEIRRKEQEDDAAIIPLFDAGSYRRGATKLLAEPGDPGFLYFHQLDQLMECVGLPMRINRLGLVTRAANSIMKVTHHHHISWYIWLLRSLHSHFDNLFIRYFGRIAIAQLPHELAGQLRQKLEKSIIFWRDRVARSAGDDRQKDRSIAIDELRLALSAQSHMTVRMTADEAVQAFRSATQIAGDPSASYSWITEAAAELANYALEAIPVDQQTSMVLDVIKFPLAAERGNHSHSWPDLVQTIGRIKPQRDGNELDWDYRIRELLAAAAPDSAGRIEALNRLAYLARHDALTKAERDAFGAALWGKTDNDPQPLPANTQLLASAIAHLPAPAGVDPIARVKARIFVSDLKEVMDCSGPVNTNVLSAKRAHLVSLYNTGPLGLSMPAERAAGLFDQIVDWNPAPADESDPFGESFKQNFNDFVRVQAGDILTFAIAPAMTPEDRSETRLTALLDFVYRTDSWRAVGAVPYFVESVPAAAENATMAIHRALSASEHLKISGGATALIRRASERAKKAD